MGDLFNVMFNLKFASKQLAKSSKKAEKDMEREKKQVLQAMAKGSIDTARIYAENAIRKKNESLNFLRLSARLDAAASRVNSAMQMRTTAAALGVTVKGMEKVLTSLDPEKITHVMDSFEKQTGQLDVVMGMTESAMASSESSVVPTSEVESLLDMVAAENNINIKQKITQASGVGLDPLEVEEREMTERLEKLKGQKLGA